MTVQVPADIVSGVVAQAAEGGATTWPDVVLIAIAAVFVGFVLWLILRGDR